MTTEGMHNDNNGFQTHQPPLYSQKGQMSAVPYGQATQQPVITTQPQTQPVTVIVQPAVTETATSAIVLAIISILCCGNLILGLIAVFFWYEADNAFKMGDVVTGRSKKKISLILSIVGIVIMVMIIIIIIVVYVVLIASVVASVSSSSSSP